MHILGALISSNVHLTRHVPLIFPVGNGKPFNSDIFARVPFYERDFKAAHVCSRRCV